MDMDEIMLGVEKLADDYINAATPQERLRIDGQLFYYLRELPIDRFRLAELRVYYTKKTEDAPKPVIN